jgi:hypothetical protein
MRALLIPVVALTLAACAGLSAEACRDAGWYDIGFRDGLFGMQAQTEAYEFQCKAHNASIDRARYTEGWRHGYWELEARRAHSGSD